MDNNYTNSIFETDWWLNVVAPGSWSETIIKKDEKIIARWAYVIHRNNIVMPKLTQTIGYYIDPEIIRDDFDLSRRKEIILELISKLPSSKSIKIALHSSNSYFLPFYWNQFIIVPRMSYRINNLTDMDAVYSRFTNMVKKKNNNAKKKLTIQIDGSIDGLMLLLKKTFEIQGRDVPYNIDLLRSIYCTAKEHSACRLIYAVDKYQNLHSGALFVHDENTCYYLIGASDPKFRNGGSSPFIIWEGIQYAATVSRSFDFEGSMVEGIENFFRGFGGTPTVYYEIRRQTFFKEMTEILKPKIKKILGYKQ